MHKFLPKIIYLLILVSMVCSCKVSKYIDENTILLHRNKIVFENKDQSISKENFNVDIENIYRQEGISKFNAWRYYYLSKPRKDTSALIKYLFKRSKVPFEFSHTEAEITAKSINNYMIQRGFFNSTTDYNFEINGHWAEVTYHIDPLRRYTVDTIIYISSDTTIQQVIEESIRDSHLRPGQPVDQQLYNLEVNRITNLLQNQGYANFFSNFISPLSGDSLNGKVKITMEILPQRGNKSHTKFKVGDIHVFSDVSPDYDTLKLFKHTYLGTTYYSEDSSYFIKPKSLSHHIFLKNDSLYSRLDYDKTLRRLGRLSAVRFVTLRPEQDPNYPDVLNYNIYISPAPRIALDGVIDVNNSNISIINQRFLGISGMIGLRHRNLFKGAEQNQFRVSSGIELNTARDSTKGNNNYFFRIENTLLLPRFIDAPGLFKLMDKIRIGNWGILNRNFYQDLIDDGSSRFSVNADFVTQRLFYSYNSFSVNYGYDLVKANRKKYAINQTGINYFTPSFTDNFIERILNNNEFLKRSLVKQFFTGFLFRDISFSYTSLQNRALETYSLFSNLEVSGAEVALLGAIRRKPIKGIGEIELSKYVRMDIDARYTRIYNDRQSAAARINVGIAAPYELSEEVPFVKQFFVGGGLSIRAWQLRSLGPGSYIDTTVERSSLDLFQTGDFKFEINGEYRYRLWSIVETAIFLDIGNVWILKEDPQRPGAKLTAKNFISDLAIGSGLGVRLVFDFFIIRLDWGIKVKNPYKINGSYLPQGTFRQLTNLNLAISYPF